MPNYFWHGFGCGLITSGVLVVVLLALAHAKETIDPDYPMPSG